MITEKECPNCGKTKPIELFYHQPGTSDGYRVWCKKCDNYRHKISRRERKEKNFHKYWADKTIETHEKRHMEVCFTKEWLEAKARDTLCCELCGDELRWEPCRRHAVYTNTPTLDRVSNEKVLTTSSVMILCHSCNSGKGTQNLDEYVAKCKRIVEKYYKMEMI